ncbi:helix-turn-helix domain-containing protein [Kineococcus sp. G2]|uniref:helix-turn-helix domain-containing protein n=1 Tax=Kineococcus sp. G2 TaxID=3127484 RepID=UPI003FA52B8B
MTHLLARPSQRCGGRRSPHSPPWSASAWSLPPGEPGAARHRGDDPDPDRCSQLRRRCTSPTSVLSRQVLAGSRCGRTPGAPGPKPPHITLSGAERDQLRSRSRRQTSEAGPAVRTRIVLAAAEGKSNAAIAAELGIRRPTVTNWRSRSAVHLVLEGASTDKAPAVERWLVRHPRTDRALERGPAPVRVRCHPRARTSKAAARSHRRSIP